MASNDTIVPVSLRRSDYAEQADKQRAMAVFSYYPRDDLDRDKTKLPVPIYSNEGSEDIECFFRTFSLFVAAMAKKGEFNPTFTQNRDCELLFSFFDTILSGSAKYDWQAVLKEHQRENRMT